METLDSAAIPQLGVPSSEDPMQLSPDTDRHLSADDDIDIELDLEVDITRDDEDNAMHEQDGGDTAHGTGNDDEMIDEEGIQISAEDHASMIDEELDGDENATIVDVQESALEEHPTEDLLPNTNSIDTSRVATAGHHQASRENSSEEIDQDDPEQSYEELEFGDLDGPGIGSGAAISEIPNTYQEPSAQSKDIAEDGTTSAISSDADIALTGPIERQTTTLSEPNLHNEQETSHTSVTQAPDRAVEPETDIESGEQQEEPASEYLHPIIVSYEGNEMSLFPSNYEAEQVQTYLLHDVAFAHGSLENLLQQCRLVLADSINEQDKLEIKIPDLGVNIDEVGYAPDLRLHRILTIVCN